MVDVKMELKPYSIARIEELHEDFKPLMKELIEIAHKIGLNVQVSCGYRSGEAQDALYEQGRTRKGAIVTNARAGESAHQYKIANDIFFLNEKGEATFDERLYKKLWNACVAQGLDKKGLSWSGSWTGKLKESVHFEIVDWKRYKK
jgi:peptidoglycan L-alanyl-D-glutamate endopeptidase CwlK